MPGPKQVNFKGGEISPAKMEGLRKVAEQPAKSITIDLQGERAAILAAIRKPNETPARTIARLIDEARPKYFDIGTPV